ncbi:unnamed protein product, partial [marine sediment metagenome]
AELATFVYGILNHRAKRTKPNTTSDKKQILS